MVQAVIDTNVVASWFLPDESEQAHESIYKNINKIRIHVPSIFPYEFINALLIAQKKKRIDQLSILDALSSISRFHLSIDHSTAELDENIRIFNLSHSYDLTAYDTAYLDLAMRLDLPLITYDTALLNTAKKLKLKTSLE